MELARDGEMKTMDRLNSAQQNLSPRLSLKTETGGPGLILV